MVRFDTPEIEPWLDCPLALILINHGKYTGGVLLSVA